MRVLIVTKIFPNPAQPQACPFNRQQFKALKQHCDVTIFATVPWFPLSRFASRWSVAGRLSGVPPRSTLDGMEVEHPRTLYVPRVGHRFSGPLYAASLARKVAALKGSVDVVLGSWLYPDGFAAIVLSRLLGVPAVVKIHGTDLNVLPDRPELSKAIRWTLASADRIVTVSRPLQKRAIELGAKQERVDVVRNGVDRSLFAPKERAAARRKLNLEALPKKLILFVGRLEASKGTAALFRAFEHRLAAQKDVGLLLVGDGSARAECERTRQRYPGRILLAGSQPLAEIPWWMAASDVVALPSDNEGTPNVVLEAFSCGRRVVATAVGGIPDLIDSPELGELVPHGDDAKLGDALLEAVRSQYDPARVRRLADVPSWAESAADLFHSLSSVMPQQTPRGVASRTVLANEMRA